MSDKPSHGALLAAEDRKNKPKPVDAAKHWSSFVRSDTYYSREVGDQICGLVASGKTIASAAKILNLVPATVHGWSDRDVDGFRARLKQAKDLCVDNMVDEIIEIADDTRKDFKIDPKTGKQVFNFEAVARSKLRIEVRKWVAAVVNPAKYAEKREIIQDSTLRIVREDPNVIDLEKDKWIDQYVPVRE